MSNHSNDSQKGTLFNRAYLLPFILVTALFLFWGIPSNMNDILIKQFMKSFELNRLQAGLIQSAYYMGYFVLAIPAGLLMRRFGYKTGLVAGLMLFALGALLFWPAAVVGKFGMFLFALFVIASGASFLETGANPFIATLGDAETSERRLNFSQAFNPLGAISGVGIGTIFILSGVEHSSEKIEAMKMAGTYEAYLHGETLRVIAPYAVLGIVVFLWGLIILFTKFPDPHPDDILAKNNKGKVGHLLKYPHFYKGVLAQFCYVGAQVGTWSFFIQYIQDYTGEHEKLAGALLTGTLVAFAVGRFSATWLMKFIKPAKLMGIYGTANIILVLLAVVIPGWIGVWSIFLTSFFMSLMFPTIFALGIKGLGENTKLGGSLMVMSIIGGAAFTPVMGVISDRTGSMALAMTLPLICYLVVTWYAVWGSRLVGSRE
ncbi:MAG: L-fucose:H+ symporter permease [Bacteroidales bacterium]|nr:L-fucose:H+ symporter permease [Bacteroidales bacterium]